MGPHVLEELEWGERRRISLLHCGGETPHDQTPSYWLPLRTWCAMELFTQPPPEGHPTQHVRGKHSPSLSSVSWKVGFWYSLPLLSFTLGVAPREGDIV